MKKKLLAMLLVLVMVLSMVPTVHAEGEYMTIQATPSVSTASAGDTVEYTITATGSGVSCLEFTLEFPEGMTYVAKSAKVNPDLKEQLEWGALDWTEKSKKWTGYGDVGVEFPADTVLMTFSVTVDTEGEHKVEMLKVKPFNSDFAPVPVTVEIGSITVGGEEETTTPEETTEKETTTEATEPEAPFLDVNVSASATTVQVGDKVDFTITAAGWDISCLEFTLSFPEGLSYVPKSAKVNPDLKGQLEWGAIDWTEKSGKWTGYGDVGVEFPAGTVLMTFSAIAEAAGTYEVILSKVKPFDPNFSPVTPNVTIDAVTVEGAAECEHSFTNYVSDGNAECEKDGTKTATCDKCDATDTIIDEGSATGHSFTNYIPDGNAECAKDGTKTATCDNCDATDTITDEGSATGSHSFTNYVSDGNAECEKDGTKTATCDNCSATDTVADEGSATGHSFTKYEADGNATCTEDGTKTATCDNCDATDTKADVGSATGHKTTLVEGTATCTQAGKIAHYVCDNCGKLFADGTALVELTEADLAADALGHIDENADEVCDRCGASLAVVPDEAFMKITVVASKKNVQVGDTVEFTVYAYGNKVSCLEFTMALPEGLEYVADSAKVPEGLKEYLEWNAVDWTEKSGKWTGYTDLGTLIEDGTVLLTFSAKATAEGTFEATLTKVLPYDELFSRVPLELKLDTVTVEAAETEPTETEPTETEPTETEPTETEPTETEPTETEPTETEPTETEPTETEPTETEPTETEPTETEPTETEPTETEPTETEPTETEPTETEPTETEPTETEPTETEPTETESTKTEPTEKPTEKPTKPGASGEEIPKTDSNSMVLVFSLMMVAAFAVLCTVLLGKKKFEV